MKQAPESCANCGAPIPRGAHACPECGADERTGWDENDPCDGLDLPPDADTEAEDEKARTNRASHSRFWWLIAFATTVAFVLLVLGLR